METTEKRMARLQRIRVAVFVAVLPNACAFLLSLTYEYLSTTNASVYFVAFFAGLPGILVSTATQSGVASCVAIALNAVIDGLITYWALSLRFRWSFPIIYLIYLIASRLAALMLLSVFIASHT